MSSFYLLQIEVKDSVKLKEYTEEAPATVKPYDGELVFRGNVSDILSGNPAHTFVAVLKFPGQAQAKAWYESKEYQDLIEKRDAAANVTVTRYDESDFF